MIQHWLYPEQPYWDGETVYILGGGPSLNDVDMDLIKDKNVIGVNEAYTLGDFVDYTFIGTNRYYNKHKHNFEGYRGQVICAGGLSTNDPRVHTVYSCNDTMTMQRGRIGIANNSGIGAINLAAQLGVKTIVLLGFDMSVIEGTNWHNKDINLNYFKRQTKESYYEKVRDTMCNVVAEALYQLDIEVINCSTKSAIDCFPILSLENYLETTEEKPQFFGDLLEDEEKPKKAKVTKRKKVKSKKDKK